MIRHLKKSLAQAYKEYLSFCKKRISQKTNKNSDLHEIRVFFKHLKAYDAFFSYLDQKTRTIKKPLLSYYKSIGAVRDAKIFAKQCTKFLPHDKALQTEATQLIEKHQKTLAKLYKKYGVTAIVRDLQTTTKKQLAILSTVNSKTLMPKLIAYLKTKELDINKVLTTSLEVSDVALHSMRTSIKDMLYLLTYTSDKNTPYLQSKVNLYTALGQSLGRRNDLTQCTNYLASQHRNASQQITFNKLLTLQQQKKIQLIEQLKQHFAPTPLRTSNKKIAKAKKKVA